MRARRISYMLLVVSMLGWGLGNPLADYAMTGITPTQSLTLEMISGLIVITVLISFRPQSRQVVKSLPMRFVIPISLLQPFLAYLLGNIGFNYGTVTTGTVLMSSEVLMMAIGGWLFLKEKLPVKGALAVLVGFCGAIIVGVAGAEGNSEVTGVSVGVAGHTYSAGLIGSLAFLGTALTGAIYSIVVKRNLHETDPFALTFVQMGVSALAAVALVALSGANFRFSGTQMPQVFAACVAGVLGTSLAYVAFIYAVQAVPMRHAALALNLIPVFAIIFGALIGRGIPNVIQLGGAALVLLSVMMIETSSESPDGTPEALPEGANFSAI